MVNQKDILYSWIRTLTVKIATFHKLIYRFSAILVHIPAVFFVKNDKLFLKCIWKCKGPRMVKTILKKKNKFGGLSVLNFKAYCKGRVIKTVVLAQVRHRGQQNGIESTEINPYDYTQLIFKKCTKEIHQGKDRLSKKWSRNCWISI